MPVKMNVLQRVALSRAFLLLPLIFILFVIVGITVEEIWFVLHHLGLESVDFIEKNEETLAILLIGFGVVMERREIYCRNVTQQAAMADNEANHKLIDICEYYGFNLLVIGLFITTVRLSLCCGSVTNTNAICYEHKSLSST